MRTRMGQHDVYYIPSSLWWGHISIQNLTKNFLAVPLVDGVFVFSLQVVSLDGFLGEEPVVRGQGLVPGHHPGGEELVPAVLLHALHEHGPVVVVGVHHGSQEVDSFKLRQPESLLSISHNLTLGGDGVEMAVSINEFLHFYISLNMISHTRVGIWRWSFPWSQ